MKREVLGEMVVVRHERMELLRGKEKEKEKEKRERFMRMMIIIWSW